MSDQRSAVEALIKALKQERDELKLKMHLASMDAKSEYDRLSAKIDELNGQYEPVSSAVGETADNVFAALKLAGEEMKSGFHRVRKAIREQD